MTHATVVIGSAFGDEGKGLLTDAHAAPAGARAVVVRFNGGAQAGHTVVAPDGRRHVFSHFGSGTLAGARTFLSRFFVANPILFLRELAILEDLGAFPDVAIDPRSPITVPWDMMINQFAEDARGTARHGSCGVGFGETIERSLTPFAVTVADLDDVGSLVARLDRIRREWVPARLAALGLGLDDARQDLILSEPLLDRWLNDADAFRNRVRPAGIEALTGAERIVFEGAQGLLLDQDRGFFPHVTRSNTGLRNAAALALDAGITALDVVYATRCYATRHGAGPFPRETEAPPYPAIRDETNRPNAYQGSLRFGHLDLDFLADAIITDLGDAPSDLRIDARLAVTCLDQAGDRTTWFESGRRHDGAPEDLVRAAGARTGITTTLTSWGPSRTTLHPL